MAERARFELAVRQAVQWFSRPPHSATLAPLRGVAAGGPRPARERAHNIPGPGGTGKQTAKAAGHPSANHGAPCLARGAALAGPSAGSGKARPCMSPVVKAGCLRPWSFLLLAQPLGMFGYSVLPDCLAVPEPGGLGVSRWSGSQPCIDVRQPWPAARATERRITVFGSASSRSTQSPSKSERGPSKGSVASASLKRHVAVRSVSSCRRAWIGRWGRWRERSGRWAALPLPAPHLHGEELSIDADSARMGTQLVGTEAAAVGNSWSVPPAPHDRPGHPAAASWFMVCPSWLSRPAAQGGRGQGWVPAVPNLHGG